MIARYIHIIAAVVICTAGTSGQADLVHEGYEFTFLHTYDCTPVTSQGKTGTCWSFSTASVLESEHHRMHGEWVDLSEMYFVRMNYILKAEAYLRYQGKSNFSEGSLSHDVMNVLARFGAMPQEQYSGYLAGQKDYDHSDLVAKLQHYLDQMITSRSVPEDWLENYSLILDEAMGSCPTEFEHQGATYTSRSFADDVLRIDPTDYITVTSFSHHPYYEEIVLQIPDNYSNGTYLNLPFEEYSRVAKSVLGSGYTISWDCDVSEKGFSSKRGLAIVPEDESVAKADFEKFFQMPASEKAITAQLREEEFHNYSLTDDHLMHITGLAKDQQGNLFYLVKNSWGDDRGFDGYLMASQAYLELNTIGLFFHKDAIPETIGAKAPSGYLGSQ